MMYNKKLFTNKIVVEYQQMLDLYVCLTHIHLDSGEKVMSGKIETFNPPGPTDSNPMCSQK